MGGIFDIFNWCQNWEIAGAGELTHRGFYLIF